MDYCAALILVGFVSLGCLGVVACVALEMRKMDRGLQKIEQEIDRVRKETQTVLWLWRNKEGR